MYAYTHICTYHTIWNKFWRHLGWSVKSAASIYMECIQIVDYKTSQGRGSWTIHILDYLFERNWVCYFDWLQFLLHCCLIRLADCWMIQCGAWVWGLIPSEYWPPRLPESYICSATRIHNQLYTNVSIVYGSRALRICWHWLILLLFYTYPWIRYYSKLITYYFTHAIRDQGSD